ncbi:MAG: PEGA domain-containing protein [Ignavibacteriales bacterium]|nr:PEGA domain-containing protein [Ignavibacteriales bacterium]
MKSIKVLIVLLLSVIILQGCKTSPPVDVESEATGRVAVSGSPENAAILVDGVMSGNFLPDTLTLKSGTHSIRVEKDGYISEVKNVTVSKNSFAEEVFNLAPVTEKKLVLLEDFANVSCSPCVQSNLVIRSLMTGTYSSEQLLIIKYHVSYPSPQDLFYQANKTVIDKRAQFYNVFSTPTSYIDGKLKPISSDSTQIKQYVNQQLAASAKFRVTVKDSVGGGTIFAKAGLKVIDPAILTPSLSGNLILHVMAIQTETSFATPPGSNGETVFYDVVRGFFTGADGTPANFTYFGEELSFNLSIPVGNGWDMTKIKVVAFLQNKLTKEIYQAAFSN